MVHRFVREGVFDLGTTDVDVKTGIGQLSSTYRFATKAVEVEVDPKTGKVTILEIASAHDSGEIFNPSSDRT